MTLKSVFKVLSEREIIEICNKEKAEMIEKIKEKFPAGYHYTRKNIIDILDTFKPTEKKE